MSAKRLSASTLLAIALAVATAPAFALLVEQFSNPNAEPAKPPAKETPYQAKLREGMTALLGGKLDAAEGALNAAAKLDAKAYAPWLGLAELAVRRGRPADAEKFAAQAISIAPKSAEAATGAGRVALVVGKHTEAEKHFQAATALDPKFIQARLDLADLQVNTDRAREAAQGYRAAIGVDPKHAGAYFGLGRALVRLGEPAEAVKSFEKSGELAPANPLPWMALSEVHTGAKAYDKAAAALDGALKAAPEYLPARLAKGDLWAVRGDPKRALVEYNEILTTAQGPVAGQVHSKIGMLHQAQKRPDDADKSYEAAIKADSNAAVAYNNRAWLAADRKRDLNEALVWAKKAVELAPKGATFHDTLATVYLARNEADPALAAARTAVGLAPGAPDYHYRLGLALELKKQNAEAVQAFQKAIELKKDFPDAPDARRRIDALGRR
ncbi:MAG: tetratricopeptide repeat protein [Burkholderiales bacterium]